MLIRHADSEEDAEAIAAIYSRSWWDVGWWQCDLARGAGDGPPPGPQST